MTACFSHGSFGGLPRLAILDPDYPNLTALSFNCMKELPASFMLDQAEATEGIDRHTTIVESSSGTFAMGLAISCNRRSQKLYIVGDPAISSDWKFLLEELGANVILVEHPDEKGSYQRPRLDLVQRLLEQNPNSFCPSQYHNPNNSNAYGRLAGLLLEAHGKVDALVGSVGSGGSTCGTARGLRVLYPHLHLVGVDTFNSVLFGQPDGTRELRGLGNSILPKNLQHSLFDEVHWIDAGTAYWATRELWRRHRLFQGPTSGAAYLVARSYARRNPDQRVAVILPDDGGRYRNTVFNQAWAAEHGFVDQLPPQEPILVTSPLDASGRWCRMEWRRRDLSSVAKRAGGQQS